MRRLKAKWGLILKAVLVVLPLLGLKVLLHYLGFEIITVGPIVTALVTGVFFVLAILLSGVLADFKESEKIPGDLTAAIEALYKDAKLVGTGDSETEMLKHVQELTHTLTANFHRRGNWKLTEVNRVIDLVDEDIRFFAATGTSMSLIIKLRNELGIIKKLSNRIEVIKETSFLPAGYAIAEFATGGALFVLLLAKIEPYYESLALLGVISTILVSVVLLIKDMDNPFEGRVVVDLRHLDKLDKYLDSRQ
jgi:hypothetical protein